MPLFISPSVQRKLAETHNVNRDEVEECFLNRSSNCRFLTDTRAQHASNPPTLWFIGHTDRGRALKIVFIQRPDGTHLRTAYEPNSIEQRIYNDNI